MAIAIKKYTMWLITLISICSCSTSNETITICGNKYDIYKTTEYDYEQKLNATTNILCFRNSRAIAFSYQCAGFRNDDNNLVYTTFKYQNDSLIVTTHFNDSVYGYPHEAIRYFKCLKNGMERLYQNGNPNYLITKRTAKKNKFRR